MKENNRKKGRTLSRLKANKELLLISLPGAIWFILFAYLPMFGIVVAFKNFRLSGGFIQSLIESEWCGFKNFKFLFYSGDMWIVFRNTICYNLVFIVLGIVLPILVALMLNEIKGRGLAKFYQSSMFLPYFLSWVVVSYFLFAFLNPEKGYINTVLQSFGKDAVSWYSEKKYWPFIILFMSQWKGIGYNTVVYLASICGIDKTYYEAAVLDGASKFQQIKYITIPLLKPVITILFILSVGRIFSADFGLFYQLPKDSGALYDYTNVLDTYVYRALMTSGELGMSSAASLFQSTVGFILIITANKIVSKIDSDNALF
ncbi:ABC transporter permease [Velocimicrobium porci]|nr:ABC transporter permease subunit [Velocimicrobium porci]